LLVIERVEAYKVGSGELASGAKEFPLLYRKLEEVGIRVFLWTLEQIQPIINVHARLGVGRPCFVSERLLTAKRTCLTTLPYLAHFYHGLEWTTVMPPSVKGDI
jgi:hypothetical protein